MIAARFRPFVICACALAVLAPLSVAAAAPQLRAPGSGMRLPALVVEKERIDRLERWIKLVARHRPGEEDAALAEIADWPNSHLKLLWLDASALVQTMTGRFHGDTATLSIRPVDTKTSVQVRYGREEFRRLQVLACAVGGRLSENDCILLKAASELDGELRQIAVFASASNRRGDRNYLVRRAAILHSDVAMLAPASMIAPGPVSRPPNSFVEAYRMEISDGQELDLHRSAAHWDLARLLLDFVGPMDSVKPSPGNDRMVREWYRATAAWMQLKESHDKLHLEQARTLFPSDPDILFLSACQREAYAGAPIQAAVRSAALPPGVIIDVKSDRTELREAEALFRRTLEIKPDFPEARMRYGRVLDLLGKHAEAAPELRQALGGLTDRQMLYYGEVFLGAAEEALGDRDTARVAYEHAAELYPMAQSPLLALSQLARRAGDRRGALGAIDRLFALPPDDRDEQDDPWWWYYVVQARDAEALLDAMQQPYRTEVLQ